MSSEAKTSIKSKKKKLWNFIFFSSGIIGFLVGMLPFIIGFLTGSGIEFTKARRTLEWAQFLQQHSLIIFWTTIFLLVFIIGISIWLHLKFFKSHTSLTDYQLPPSIKIGRSLISFGAGYLAYELIVYLVIDQIYYHRYFVSIPYLIGMGILLCGFILFFTNIDLIQNIVFPLFQELVKTSPENRLTAKKSSKSILRGIKDFGIILLALFFVLPNFTGMGGFRPIPPGRPATGYGSSLGPFEVDTIRIENQLPSLIEQCVIQENQNETWYIYLFLPDYSKYHQEYNLSLSQIHIPVAFFLHGYSGTNYREYYDSLETLAAQGIAVIFVQYATAVNATAILENIENATLDNSPDSYIRYNMTWTGIKTAVDAMNQQNSLVNPSILNDLFTSNYTLDLSRLLIIGHSYGGGMSLYIGTKALQQGWGTNELIFDLEAPWYSSEWSSVQANMTLLPDHCIINVVGYQDDITAHPCIGMQHFERFLLRDNSTMLNTEQTSYLFIQSDRYGFPRLVATHYLCTDALRDSLANFGYFKRIDAMAGYLRASGYNDTVGMEEAKAYFTNGHSQMVDMGVWSNGVSVKPLIYSTDPLGIRTGPSILPYLLDSNHSNCSI